MATGAPTAQRQAVPVRQRPRADQMTAAQVKELRAAFAALQKIADERGYEHFAELHGLPLPSECGIAHGHPAFLPWHRAYLLRFEQALRDTGHDVMLPWWDWTRTREVPAIYKEENAPEGSPNPLYSARISELARQQGARAEGKKGEVTRWLAQFEETVRQPGFSGARLPTRAEIEYTIAEHKQYDQFRSELEDYHGEVHIWVGGHMGNLPFAAFDPIFWAHHCMIDRIWRVWQLEHPGASFPETLRDKTMTPFNLTAGAVLDPTALGYDYALSVTQVRPG
jgi:tyrosinase